MFASGAGVTNNYKWYFAIVPGMSRIRCAAGEPGPNGIGYRSPAPIEMKREMKREMK
jgi:hypothetical protein